MGGFVKLGRVKYQGNIYKALFVPDKEIAYLYESDFYSENITIPVPFSDLEFLPPVSPSNIIAMGFNYKDHIKEAEARGLTISNYNEPIITFKGINTLAAHKQKIQLPRASNIIEFEGEFTIVIGRRCKDITPEEAKKYILGYTLANDVTARDFQFKDGQWARAKGIDFFCPVGPWIETKLDPNNVDIKTSLNGTVIQHANTNSLIMPVYKLVSYISKFITMKPGDIILTGTPSGMKNIRHGDVVSVHSDAIGTLSNMFVKPL